MISKIIIPILILLILTLLQLVVVPLISIDNVVPNIVLVYVLFYSLKNGQNAGTIFAFFMGFIYDLSSSGLIGSGMFSFTVAAFIAGYFFKEDFNDIVQNPKILILLFMLSSSLFFFFYSVLGSDGISIESQYSVILYSIFSALYTTLISLSIYLIPRNKL